MERSFEMVPIWLDLPASHLRQNRRAGEQLAWLTRTSHMNQELQKAETALLSFLAERTNGATMEEILAKLQMDEAEVRAAVWTLRAEGKVDFEDGRLRQVVAA
jgi:hypothetical protein